MTELLAWGILGAATIARKCVIPAIHASSSNTVQVIGSRDPASAASLARKHDIQSVVEGYDAVLKDPHVEAVYIPLPNHLHREWAINAFEAGKHVLCEKPLAVNALEAAEMIAAAQDAGKMLMEGFMYRFHPRSRRIFQMTAEGRIGVLKLVRAAFCYRMDETLRRSGKNFRLRPETGGGALLDVGCYGVSTARWFFGKEPISVQAQAEYHPNGVDVHLVGTLKFEGGGLAVVEASFISALQQTFTLVGSGAVVELPHDAYIPWEKDAVYSIRNVDQETGETITVPGDDEYRLMVEHFADVVQGRSQLDHPPEDSLANMRILDALAEAAISGRTVYIEE